MRKILIICLVVLISFSVLCACGTCSHAWNEATCTAPKECTKCGLKLGDSLGHDYDDGNCTEARKCKLCSSTTGEPLGHDYQNGFCQRCYKNDENYITLDDVFPGKPDYLIFTMNSVGGIEVEWQHKYKGSKSIDYIGVIYTLYDSVGNPLPDDIKKKSSGSFKLAGPFKGKSTIEWNSHVFVYASACKSVSFDKFVL